MHSEPLNMSRQSWVRAAIGVMAMSGLSRAPACADDWRVAAASVQPAPALVEVLFRLGESDLNAAGVDMGSGAWYRFVGGRAWGYVPGVGAFESRSGGSPPKVGPGPRRDQFVERYAFPFVMTAGILAEPAKVMNVEKREKGWALTVGDEDGEPFVIWIGADGRVEAVGSPSAPDPLAFPAGAPEGYPIGGLRSLPVELTILDASVSRAGSPASPALTLKSVENRFRVIFSRQSDLTLARAEAMARDGPRLPPGAERPDGSGSTRYSGERRFGPALIIAGVVVLLIAVAAWWKNRGA